MDTMDATTWRVIGLTLSLVLLVVGALVWQRRGPVAGLRAVAWALLPAAAGLTGTLRLLWQIGESIVDWAVRLVFSPVVWIGVATAGVSLMLFVLTAALRARGVGRRDPAEGDRPRRRAVASNRPAPADKAAGGGDDGDMDDIEAILRKHGIS